MDMKIPALQLMGILFYFLTMLMMDGILELMNLDSVVFVDDFIVNAVSVFVSVFGAVAVGLKLGFYERIIPDARGDGQTLR